MGAKITFDPVTRIAQITQAPSLIDGEMVVEIDVKMDYYSDCKEDWKSNAGLCGYPIPMRSVAGDPTVGIKKLGATFFLAETWKIRPYEADHVLRVHGNLFRDDGKSPYTAAIGGYSVLLESTVSSLVDSTVQQLDEIEYATFQNAVWIDIVNGYPLGYHDLIGNSQYPVDNVPDAMTIATTRGFDAFNIIGDLTLTSGDNVSDMIFTGENVVKTKLTVETGADVLGCEFKNMLLTGILDGKSTITNCLIEDLNYVEGTIAMSGLLPGTLTLGGTGVTRLINCWSEGCINDPPIIDVGGSGRSLLTRGLSGPFKLINKTGASDYCCLDFASGDLLIDATVTDGDIRLGGVMTFTNNSSVDIITDGVMNSEYIVDMVLDELLENHTISGSLGDILTLLWDEAGGDRKIDENTNQEIFYKAGGVEVMRFNLFDVDGNPSHTKVYERVRV